MRANNTPSLSNSQPARPQCKTLTAHDALGSPLDDRQIGCGVLSKSLLTPQTLCEAVEGRCIGRGPTGDCSVGRGQGVASGCDAVGAGTGPSVACNEVVAALQAVSTRDGVFDKVATRAVAAGRDER